MSKVNALWQDAIDRICEDFESGRADSGAAYKRLRAKGLDALSARNLLDTLDAPPLPFDGGDPA